MKVSFWHFRRRPRPLRRHPRRLRRHPRPLSRRLCRPHQSLTTTRTFYSIFVSASAAAKLRLAVAGIN